MGTVNYVQKGMPRFKTREKEPNLLSEPRANLGIRNDKPNKFQKQKKSRVKRKTKVLIFFFFFHNRPRIAKCTSFWFCPMHG